MIKLIEEGISEAEISWKLGPLCQTFSHTVDAKEKFLKEIKCDSSQHTNDKKVKQHIAHIEKVLVVWMEATTFP